MDFSGAPVKRCQGDCVQHPGCPGSSGVFPSNEAHATHLHSFVTAAGPIGSAQEQMPKPKETAPLSHGVLPR